MKGKLITFEGSEGSGKSTQSRLLYQYLKRKGFDAVYLREPGGTHISEKIRKILLDPLNHILPVCEMLLYMAARSEVAGEIIRPQLIRGRIVICDRFLDSTLVYQGYGLGVDVSSIRAVGDIAALGIKPDLTILLDLPVKKGLKHREFKEDRIEQRPFAYHSRVRKGYLELAAEEPQRIKIVKVQKDIRKTQEKIIQLIEEYVI